MNEHDSYHYVSNHDDKDKTSHDHIARSKNQLSVSFVIKNENNKETNKLKRNTQFKNIAKHT